MLLPAIPADVKVAETKGFYRGNPAAGLMRQLDSRKVADQPFDIVFHELPEIDRQAPASHGEARQQFPERGLKTCPHNCRA